MKEKTIPDRGNSSVKAPKQMRIVPLKNGKMSSVTRTYKELYGVNEAGKIASLAHPGPRKSC